MCGRYAFNKRYKDIAEVIDLEIPSDGAGSSNIAPSETVPVIKAAADSLAFDTMKWGYVPGWPNGPKFIINLRSETILEKKFASSALQSRRCVLPATSFLEWMKITEKEKHPVLFELLNGGIFGLAGIYFADAKGQEQCLLLTTAANELVTPVHDRMPVMLKPQDWSSWILEKNAKKAVDNFAKPFAASEMDAWKVDKQVSKAAYKGEVAREERVLAA